MSTSDVPLVDTRLTDAEDKAIESSVPPSYLIGYAIRDFPPIQETDTLMSDFKFNTEATELKPVDQRCSVQKMHRDTPSSTSLMEDQVQKGRASASPKRRWKEGKARWFSQLKEWVSVSEPSTQALKDYKKDTYKKAGIALDDPMANAKLHLPVASLPSNVIKPGGRGPEPEEVALQRARQRKQARELLAASGTSQESHFTTNTRFSSSSSIVMSLRRDGY